MQAAVYEQFQQPLALQTAPDPAPSASGALIAVKANGICRSDWRGQMGHDPDIHLSRLPEHIGFVEAASLAVFKQESGACSYLVILAHKAGYGCCQLIRLLQSHHVSGVFDEGKGGVGDMLGQVTAVFGRRHYIFGTANH